MMAIFNHLALTAEILAELCAVSIISTGSLGARSYPLSYVYAGQYHWYYGRLYFQAVAGFYWSSSIYHSAGSYRLYMDITRSFIADTDNKRSGVILRCYEEISDLL